MQKQQMIENREKEIINYISTNAHDPKTKTPIPTQRIINSFKELKIKINLAKTKEKEIEEIIKEYPREILEWKNFIEELNLPNKKEIIENILRIKLDLDTSI